MIPVGNLPPINPAFIGQLGPLEILLIIVIALILFGPKKLPELAKAAGEAVRIFREESRKLTEEDTQTVRTVSSGSSSSVSDEDLKKLAEKLGISTDNKSRDELINEIVTKAKEKGLI